MKIVRIVGYMFVLWGIKMWIKYGLCFIFGLWMVLENCGFSEYDFFLVCCSIWLRYGLYLIFDLLYVVLL